MPRLTPMLGLLACTALLLCHPTEAAVVEVAVTIKSVDVQAREITVGYATKTWQKTIQLVVGPNAKITVSGTPATLGSLKPGQKATVSFDKELMIVTTIDVKGSTTSLQEGSAKTPSQEHGDTIDLLAQVVPERDAVLGDWKRDRNTITSVSNIQCARLMFPTPVHGSYDLLLRFTHQVGNCIAADIPVGTHGATIILNGGKDGDYDNIESIYGKGGHLSPAVRTPSLLKHGQASNLLAKVRLHGHQVIIDVVLDGTQLVRWSGRQDALRILDHWKLPDSNKAGFGYRASSVILHAAELKRVQGD